MAQEIRIVGQLAAGGFGSVLLARRFGAQGFQKEVVIKVLHAQEQNGGQRANAERREIERRLRDEAVLLGLLDHPNIVGAHDLLSLDGQPAVEMEFVRGVDLAAICRDGPLPSRVALLIVADVASALWYAYTHGRDDGRPLRIVHRDIKPANIVIGVHGQVKVLDFGIARGDFERQGVTRSMQFGTASYMPPEAYLTNWTGPAGDVFALGVALARTAAGVSVARWVAGAPNFKAQHDDWIAQVETALPAGPTKANVVELIRAMTSYDPRSRLPTDLIEQEARSLADRTPGPTLSEFAVNTVKPAFNARRAGLEPWSDDAQPTIGRLVEKPTFGPAIPAATRDHVDRPPVGEPSSRPVHQAPPRRGAIVAVAAAVALSVVALGGGLLTWSWIQRAGGTDEHTRSAMDQRTDPPTPEAAQVTVPTVVRKSSLSPQRADHLSDAVPEINSKSLEPVAVSEPGVHRPHNANRTDGSRGEPMVASARPIRVRTSPSREVSDSLPSSEIAAMIPTGAQLSAQEGTPQGPGQGGSPSPTTQPSAGPPQSGVGLAALIVSCDHSAMVWAGQTGPKTVPARFELPSGYTTVRMAIQTPEGVKDARKYAEIPERGELHYRCDQSQSGQWTIQLQRPD